MSSTVQAGQLVITAASDPDPAARVAPLAGLPVARRTGDIRLAGSGVRIARVEQGV